MTEFAEQDFILFDVQTTGTNPESSLILEAGWGVYRAALDPLTVDWNIRLLALPESTVLPRRIQKLTGLSIEDWTRETVVSAEEWAATFQRFLHQHEGLPILVHYARFKQPFLLKALGGPLANRVVCSYELARYALPQLKSHSLRAVAGYAGFSLGDKKRSRDHLTATAFIWQHLVSGARVATPDLRQKRLQLPDQPGVYFFVDHTGRVLYVGKASSLKARLNSYFRGRKTKGSRLNEMLTRAVDFRTVVVRHELEALLRESDEIKRHDPPYNRLLKADDRQVRSLRWGAQVLGPLLWIPRLEGDQEPAALRELAIALWKEAQIEKEDEEKAVEETEEVDADNTERLLVRFVDHVLKSRWLLRLVECNISWRAAGAAPVFVRVRAGVPSFENPWSDDIFPESFGKSRLDRLNAIDVPTYDRLTILYHEIRAGVRRGDLVRLSLRPGLTLDQDRLRQLLPIRES